MGIETRLDRLSSSNPHKSDELEKSVKRLVGTDSGSMGIAYKVFAVAADKKDIWPFTK